MMTKTARKAYFLVRDVGGEREWWANNGDAWLTAPGRATRFKIDPEEVAPNHVLPAWYHADDTNWIDAAPVVSPEAAIAQAIRLMREARGLLRQAGAGRAADAQAAAIKSAEGAARHARQAAVRPDMRRKGAARRAGLVAVQAASQEGR